MFTSVLQVLVIVAIVFAVAAIVINIIISRNQK